MMTSLEQLMLYEHSSPWICTFHRFTNGHYRTSGLSITDNSRDCRKNIVQELRVLKHFESPEEFRYEDNRGKQTSYETL